MSEIKSDSGLETAATGGVTMADDIENDIDQLLDEVESKFLAKSNQKFRPPVPKRKHSNPDTAKSRQAKLTSTPPPPPERHSTLNQSDSLVLPETNTNVNRTDSNELKDAIDDICSLPESTEDIKRSGQSNIFGHLSLPPPQKCFTIYLGGSCQYPGLSSSSAPRPCSNLRCTTCDFKVVMFNDLVWDKLTDHLFLRNNMPDYERLKQRLQRAKGWRAYACQCHCTSMNSLVEVRKHEILKWVCGSH